MQGFKINYITPKDKIQQAFRRGGQKQEEGGVLPSADERPRK